MKSASTSDSGGRHVSVIAMLDQVCQMNTISSHQLRSSYPAATASSKSQVLSFIPRAVDTIKMHVVLLRVENLTRVGVLLFASYLGKKPRKRLSKPRHIFSCA